MGVVKNMKANKKFVEENEAVSAVIGVILMVAITVAIAATVYVYVSGLAGSPGEEKENASVTVTTDSSMIKITLTSGGEAQPITGYTKSQCEILINGTKDPLSGVPTNFGWEVGEALWITNSTATVSNAKGTQLGSGQYSITIVIADTVIYDNVVNIA